MERSAGQAARIDAPGAEHAEWIARARRLAPTIDGVEYFRCLRRSLVAARRQVWIVGWDFHSEIDLLRGEEAERARREERWPVRLADLLERLVEERDELRVRILVWEGASLFALDRQHLPRMKRPWSAHPRIALEWDRDTPRLASQHEKLVVVDDHVAYAGGMDLTKSRWDDHRHAIGDARRRDPGLLPSYGSPYHDLMLAVDGEAARVLGEWCRERWRRATGERVEAPEGPPARGDDPWPAELEPLLREREVAIVRTQPEHAGRAEKRQVERSYLAQVRAARSLVYIETQYLTHAGLVDALVERLREPDGPEIVLILPWGCPEPLQSMALDPHRDELLERLRGAAPQGRLCVAWPTLAGGSERDVHERSVYVHAKCMVVDDRLLRVGSSNLNNRSMGLDAELDLFVQVGEDEEEARQAVAGFRRRSLAYLLQVDPRELEAAERERGSVVAAIAALQGGSRTLRPFEHRAAGLLHSIELPLALVDPARPLEPEDVERVLGAIEANKRLLGKVRKGANVVIGALRRRLDALALGAALVGLVLLWRLTPLRELTSEAALADAAEAVRASPAGLAGVLGAFLLLAAAGFPLTVLIATVGAMFDAALSIPISLLGVAGSAWVGFFAGRLLRARRGGRTRSARLERVVRRFAGRGVLAVAVLRNLPVAPFTIVNAGCGMSGIPWWTFFAGTLLGTLPGILVVGFFGHEIGRWIADPSWTGLLQLACIAALVVGAVLAADVLLRRFGPARADEDEGAS